MIRFAFLLTFITIVIWILAYGPGAEYRIVMLKEFRRWAKILAVVSAVLLFFGFVQLSI